MNISIRPLTEHKSVTAAALFLSQHSGAQPSYISHGELTYGYATSLSEWSEQHQERVVEDLIHGLNENSIGITGAFINSSLAGISITSFLDNHRKKVCLLEDLIIDPQYGNQGIGTALLSHVENLAANANCDLLMLESGINNTHAHTFFANKGFSLTSKVFIKRIE